MFGSYLGALILGFIPFNLGLLGKGFAFQMIFGSGTMGIRVLGIIIIIIGFLIGWGVHLLIRKLMR